MKKRLFLICLLGLLVLAGCDGSGWSKTIKAQAHPSMNVLELNVGARLNPGNYLSYGGNQFTSELAPLEIVQRGGSVDFTAEAVRRADEPAGYLLSVKQENGAKDFYWLTQTIRKDGEQWYRYTGMRYRLRPEQEVEGAKALYALIPAFALDAVTSNRNEQDLTLGQSYHCNAVTVGETDWPEPQQLFAAFYRASGWYDVEEDGIVLTVRPKGEDSGAALRFSFEDGNGEPHVHIDLAAE